MSEKSTLQKLQEYADLESSEIGDLCILLIDIHNFYPYFLTKGFLAAINKEIEKQLKNFEDNTTITFETVTEEHKVKTLVWNDD